MSEDKILEKLREQAFELRKAAYEFGLIDRAEDHDRMMEAQRSLFDEMEAWAAIKDAKIAEHNELWKDLRNVLECTQREVAARDLMIKEWAELFEKVKTALFYGECSINERNPKVGSKNEGIARMMESAQNEIEQALAKSEHHNSRALEKMLLEARIDVLNTCSGRMVMCSDSDDSRAYKKGYNAKVAETNKLLGQLTAKLAELNKE